jgi:hypothetical protein
MRSRWLLAVQLAATLFSALFSLDDRGLLPSPISAATQFFALLLACQ